MPVCLHVMSRFASHMRFDESHECKQVVINLNPKASFKHLEQTPNPKYLIAHYLHKNMVYLCLPLLVLLLGCHFCNRFFFL